MQLFLRLLLQTSKDANIFTHFYNDSKIRKTILYRSDGKMIPLLMLIEEMPKNISTNKRQTAPDDRHNYAGLLNYFFTLCFQDPKLYEGNGYTGKLPAKDF
ncbi:hypothetical protein O3G_MSEX008020 [Manduca sexta]|uniref:Uncharacterized protein n=1 Tax=Manduca sexta TaxID=7130 RepID=A0A922CNW1_MANSE|nr:hypothetical protein O3G_MSEX008020 [Manduca sexta]